MEKSLAKNLTINLETEKYKQRRYLDYIFGAILVNEKEAYVSLRGINGLIDYTGFIGTDSKFRKWCIDLFNYYWEKAHRWYPGIKIE